MDQRVGEKGEDHLVAGSKYARIYLVFRPIFVPHPSSSLLVEGEKLYQSTSVLNLTVARRIERGSCDGEVDGGGGMLGGYLSRDVTSAGTSTNHENSTSMTDRSPVPSGMGSFSSSQPFVQSGHIGKPRETIVSVRYDDLVEP